MSKRRKTREKILTRKEEYIINKHIKTTIQKNFWDITGAEDQLPPPPEEIEIKNWSKRDRQLYDALKNMSDEEFYNALADCVATL